MSVYKKEKGENLRISLGSIFKQTIPPDEVVLVEDGELTPELYAVIDSFLEAYPERIKIVKFQENKGLWKALQEGILHCQFDLVARMDSDDISKPHRFEEQLKTFEKYPEIAVCSAWVEEFVEDTKNIISIRKLPKTHAELYRFGKRYSPVNHPVVMFRKREVIESGNYRNYYLFEDYDLWSRMLMKGCRFYCIPESLLYYRHSPDMIKRRGGLRYALVELKFQWNLYQIHYIGLCTLLSNIIIRFPIRIIPYPLRSYVYELIRKKQNRG